MDMQVEALRYTDWVQAATKAHMILSQSLTDEMLDRTATATLQQGTAVERWAA
jgi:hypothetical protein